MSDMSDMSIDTAQQRLGDLGYMVTVDTDTGSIVGDLTQGRHHAMVAITPGHTGQLVTQWFSETPDAQREQTCQYGPDTIQQAVECATAVAGVIGRANEADQVPAIIYDQLVAKYAGKAAEEDSGIDFPGLEEACYGPAEVDQAPADAAPTKCSACTDGHTYSGDCRYEVVTVAEIELQSQPAQDRAEPDSAVTA